MVDAALRDFSEMYEPKHAHRVQALARAVSDCFRRGYVDKSLALSLRHLLGPAMASISVMVKGPHELLIAADNFLQEETGANLLVMPLHQSAGGLALQQFGLLVHVKCGSLRHKTLYDVQRAADVHACSSMLYIPVMPRFTQEPTCAEASTAQLQAPPSPVGVVAVGLRAGSELYAQLLYNLLLLSSGMAGSLASDGEAVCRIVGDWFLPHLDGRFLRGLLVGRPRHPLPAAAIESLRGPEEAAAAAEATPMRRDSCRLPGAFREDLDDCGGAPTLHAAVSSGAVAVGPTQPAQGPSCGAGLASAPDGPGTAPQQTPRSGRSGPAASDIGALGVSAACGKMKEGLEVKGRARGELAGCTAKDLQQDSLWMTFRSPAVEREFRLWQASAHMKPDVAGLSIVILIYGLAGFKWLLQSREFVGSFWTCFVTALVPIIAMVHNMQWYRQHREVILLALVAYQLLYNVYVGIPWVVSHLLSETTSLPSSVIRYSGVEAMICLPCFFMVRFVRMLPLQFLLLAMILHTTRHNMGLCCDAMGTTPDCIRLAFWMQGTIGMAAPIAIVYALERNSRATFKARLQAECPSGSRLLVPLVAAEGSRLSLPQ